MLVYLHQYREPDTTENLRSDEEVVDQHEDEYFDVDDLSLDEWERVEHGGRTLQRRAVDYDAVTALSAPEEAPESDLPGQTLQLRRGGETEYVDHAVVVEIQDPDP